MNKIVFWLALIVALRASAFIDASLQLQLGNPSNAAVDTNNHNHYLIQRAIEALDYNDSRGQANWASWDLTSGDANNAVVRQDSYAADTSLPANFYEVGASEYSGSGFDRGHLCPSADRTDSTNDNDMTFLMSNMMPQAPDNNRITWNGLENYCRTLADAGNEILIMCGPSGFNGSHISSSTHVLIPSNTWKVAVMVPLGSGTALSRITTTTNRVIAVLVPNTNGVSANWSNYVTSAHQIELETGLSFFTALPGTIASAFRAKIDNLSNPPPPGITSFNPASGLANTNVVITGTNFNGASAVRFNGADAVFIVDSNTQITAVVPTNATTGAIAVTTPGGTAASSDNYTVSSSGTPDLAITSSHSSNFTQGDTGDTLAITVKNTGAGASSGTVTVSNALPARLTATGINGAGWTTSLTDLTATRSDALGAGSTYPTLTIVVEVATNAPAMVTNTATVTGGSETNFANDSATDIITIKAFANTNPGPAIVTLLGWDVSGQSNFGSSPLPPTTNTTGLTVGGLTRGAGVGTTTSGTAALRAWGGTDWTSSTSVNAIASHQFVTFSVAPQSGYKVSFTNISRFDYRRSTTGPANGLVQFQLNSGGFFDITNVSYNNSTSSGASIAPIDLSGIAALQDVGSGTNVTFRIVNYGGTSSVGTWYIFDVANTTALDFAVKGVVTQVSTNAIPVAPILSLVTFTNNQFHFTIVGTMAYSYAIESSTNLSDWISIVTNSSPFAFTDTNFSSGALRFYRARFVP